VVHPGDSSRGARELFGVSPQCTDGSLQQVVSSDMAAPLALGDDDLLRRLAAGDEEAFTALYRRHQGPLYRFVLRMSGSAGLAEDVTQEAFMALFERPDGYDPERGGIAAYLYGIARRKMLRRLERDRRYASAALDEDAGASDERPFDTLSRQEAIVAVRRALLALSPNYREVVVLCELEGLSYAEAAAALGCALGTVRSRLHRARGLLLRALRGLSTVSLREGLDTA
jgi:RNA polymerase sigma-70 factor (ECF subfamily)